MEKTPKKARNTPATRNRNRVVDEACHRGAKSVGTLHMNDRYDKSAETCCEHEMQHDPPIGEIREAMTFDLFVIPTWDGNRQADVAGTTKSSASRDLRPLMRTVRLFARALMTMPSLPRRRWRLYQGRERGNQSPLGQLFRLRTGRDDSFPTRGSRGSPPENIIRADCFRCIPPPHPCPQAWQ